MSEPEKKPDSPKVDKPDSSKLPKAADQKVEEGLVKKFEDAIKSDVVVPMKITQPPAAKAAELPTAPPEDVTVITHLKYIAAFPVDSMQVIDFRDQFGLGANAILVLKTYEQDGLLRTHWVGSANRYSLTEAGLQKIS